MTTDQILTDKHLAFGLTIDETDDHCVFLRANGRIIGAFNRVVRTGTDIQKTADDYLLQIDAQ